MSIRKWLVTTALTALVVVALGAIGPVVAQAAPTSERVVAVSPSPSANLPLSVSVQNADQLVVANFLASHPVPLESAGRSAPGVPTVNSQWHTFLAAVPWSALYGQWGCVLKQVEVTPGPAKSAPTFGTISNCGGAEVLVPLVGTFATRTATLATPEGAAARYLYASAKSRGSQRHPFGTLSPARAANFVSNGGCCGRMGAWAPGRAASPQ
jgi:hypothetical protein